MVPAAKAKATKGSRTDPSGSPEASRLLLRRKSSGPPGKAPRTSGLPGQVPASVPNAGASGPGAVAVARRSQDHSLLFQDAAMLPIQAKQGGLKGHPKGEALRPGARADGKALRISRREGGGGWLYLIRFVTAPLGFFLL